MSEEVWKDVVGYEGDYIVSNLGNVMSLNYGVVKEKKVLIKRQFFQNGYYYVNLKCKPVPIHRIIAMAFIPNPLNKPQIDHINTIKTDNRIENLRWVTLKENMNNPLTRKHASNARIGYRPSKESVEKMRTSLRGRKLSEGHILKMRLTGEPVVMFSLDGKFIRKFAGASFAKEELGVAINGVSECCNGNKRTCGGYMWRWLKDYKGGDIEPYVRKYEGRGKTVFVYDTDENFICTCSSTSDAERKFGLSDSSIQRVCCGHQKSSHGLIFSYKKL